MAVDWAGLRRSANRQHDLLTLAQCRAAGLGDRAVQWRVRSGRWVRLHPCVYLTRPGRSEWIVTASARLLSLQRDPVVGDVAFCGRSAAHLWGVQPQPPPRLDLVVPYTRCPRPIADVAVRRSMRWADLIDDRAWPWRTTLPATVLDVAADGSPTDCLATVARAVQQQRVSVAELRQELARRPGHRHGAVLRPALADVAGGAQSGAELLYLRDVERAHGLPRSVSQSPSDAGRRRWHDHEYAAYRLIVEVDGRLGHEQWADRVRDGRRDRLLLGSDRATTRVFWADVAVTPCRTAHDIAAILTARGWAGRVRPCRRPGCGLGHGRV
ncbi:type IV toxin-antitoxin system AbiEi family antitoxin domain-containing protein [Pedococcus soli]